MLGMCQCLLIVLAPQNVSANAAGVVFYTSYAPEDEEMEHRCVVKCEMIRTCLHILHRSAMKRLSVDIVKL